MPRHHVHFEEEQPAQLAQSRVPDSRVTKMASGGYCLAFDSDHLLVDAEKRAITSGCEVTVAYWNIGYYQHSFEFASVALARDSVTKLPPHLGYRLVDETMNFYTVHPLGDEVRAALFGQIQPRSYELDIYVDAIFEDKDDE